MKLKSREKNSSSLIRETLLGKIVFGWVYIYKGYIISLKFISMFCI